MIVAIHTDGDQDLTQLQLPAAHPGTSGAGERHWRLEQIAEAYRQLASGQRRLLRCLTDGGEPECAADAVIQIDHAERLLQALGVDEIYLGTRRGCAGSLGGCLR